MTHGEALRLGPGDKVRWTDPDEGACSRDIVIRSCEVIDDAFCIVDEDGSVVECLPEELS